MSQRANPSRVLATIMFTDAVGFSAKMSEHESHTVAMIQRDLKFITATCLAHHGRVLKNTGDGLLMYFTSAGDALATALQIQAEFAKAMDRHGPENTLQHRVGIHLGDVLLGEADVMGDGVNIAARLLGEAEPGGICFSQTVYDVVKNRLALKATYLGPRELKNIRDAVPVYQIIARDQALRRLAPDDSEDSFRLLSDSLRNALLGQGWAGKALWGAVTLCIAALLVVFFNTRNPKLLEIAAAPQPEPQTLIIEEPQEIPTPIELPPATQMTIATPPAIQTPIETPPTTQTTIAILPTTRPTAIALLPATRPTVPTPPTTLPSLKNYAPAVSIELANGVSMKLVLIKPGEFVMGSPADEPERENDETQHKVQITRPYYMAVTELTQRQWKAVMGASNNPSQFKGDDLPLENITSYIAVEFCQKLSAKTGKMFRLPTEAQWEYACRAGTTTPYNSSSTLDQLGWFKDNANGKTHPVAQKKPNAWGLFDMHGNVYEICTDWFAAYPKGPVSDPTGPNIEKGDRRVFRGGAWTTTPQICRSAARAKALPDYKFASYGIRCVMDIP